MKLWLVFLTSALVYNEAKEDVSFYIVGGEEADIEEVPYQVSIEIDAYGTGVFSHNCGGSIISPSVIVTASHCFTMSTNPASYKVRAGSSFAGKGGQLVKVKKITTHPQFDNDITDFDVALLHLKTPLKFSEKVASIRLPKVNSSVPVGAHGRITGWGALKAGGASPEQLRKTDVKILEQKICIDMYKNNPITERMFCALTDGRDSCQGDSGGPMAIDNVLVGITSWGVGCANMMYPGVYTKVSYFRDWIDKNK